VRAGESYEVVSLVPAQGPAPRHDPLPPLASGLRQKYLQLPPGLPGRIGDLARQIVAGSLSPYDAALSIQNHLSREYEYTTRPKPRPEDADFVDHFLFVGKSGYCQHFASAMVVMCRALGMPARLVSGFVAGELDPQEGTYEVRGKDAHTWAEVYIEGRGWQSFEPTPPLDEREQQRLTPARVVARLREAWVGLTARAATLGTRYRWVTGALGLALCALLSLALVRRHRWYTQTRLAARGVTPEARVGFVYDRLLGWLGHFGLRRLPSEPPLEYMNGLPTQAGGLSVDVGIITGAYLRAVYGRGGVSEAEAAAAEGALERVRRALFTDRVLQPARPDAVGE